MELNLHWLQVTPLSISKLDSILIFQNHNIQENSNQFTFHKVITAFSMSLVYINHTQSEMIQYRTPSKEKDQVVLTFF